MTFHPQPATPSRLRIEAPARLHFGLFSFGNPNGRQFGGVGAMIGGQDLLLEIEPAPEFGVTGSWSERVRCFAERWQKHTGLPELRCRIDVVQAPRQHVGLGSGTQLALSVAAGLNAWHGLPAQSAQSLTMSVGRGERSAIGTYGFLHGGLLVEAGKLAHEALSPLLQRVALPEQWRFVLFCPPEDQGMSGEEERAAFAALPPVPAPVTAQLCEETLLHILPAAIAGNINEFSESVYRFGHQAGLCFAARQHGAFASQRLALLVAELRRMGVQGVGQSSWGPTIFALTPGQAEAEELSRAVGALDEFADLAVTITTPCNRGARISASP